MYTTSTMDESDVQKAEIYNDWNQKKQILDSRNRNLLFKEGEIWWCSLGINIGEEVYGKGSEFRRPVVILKKLTNNSCIVFPITSKPRSGTWYHKICVHKQSRWIMLNQIRSISANRFLKRDASIPLEDFIELKKIRSRTARIFLNLPRAKAGGGWVFPKKYSNEYLRTIASTINPANNVEWKNDRRICNGLCK